VREEEQGLRVQIDGLSGGGSSKRSAQGCGESPRRRILIQVIWRGRITEEFRYLDRCAQALPGRKNSGMETPIA
jgi:hypothetical protein